MKLHISVEQNCVSSGLVNNNALMPERRRARMRRRVKKRSKSSTGSSLYKVTGESGSQKWLSEVIFLQPVSQPFLKQSLSKKSLNEEFLC